MSTMGMSLSGDAIEFFDKAPEKLKDAVQIALTDIGMRGSAFAKTITPYKTGNLRRSETYGGSDSFPFLKPRKDDRIPEAGGRPLSGITDTVFIGTNLIYAGPMERIYEYMANTLQYLEQGVVEQIVSREIDRKLEGR